MPPYDPLDDPEAVLASLRSQLADAGVDAAEIVPPPEPTTPAASNAATSKPAALDSAMRGAANADPRLLALVEQRFRPEIARSHSLPSYLRELRTHLDPEAWGTGFLEVSEGGPPLEVREALREQTPQALLRDLHRPEYSRDPVPLDFLELPLDPGGRAAFAELRAALAREPLPVLERSVESVRAIVAERRGFLREPWRPFLDDEEPRREVIVAIEPSLSE